jgi:hypothetical protein
MTVADIGALCFGVVVGWIVYRTLRRRTDSSALSDVATVIGVVGGAAVTAVFKTETLFGFYSIGLAAGFFVYLVASLIIAGNKKVDEFMG